MRYRIIFATKAEKEFDDLPKHIQRRIGRWIDLLSVDPRREGTKKLEGHGEFRRVHASKDYVIVYSVLDEEVVVLIVRVAHRKDVYRGF